MVIAAVAGLLVGAVLALVAGAWFWALLGLVLGACAGAAGVLAAIRGAPAAALSGVVAVPADPERHARLHNLTDGLCITVGLSKPELLVIETSGANAAAVARTPTDAVLVVTSGLLDGLDRVELEGVLAHQLRRIRDQEALVATRAVVLAARPAVMAPSLAPRLAPLLVTVDDVFLDDRAAVDVTRYPPGLVGALAKVRDLGSVVPGASAASAHLWLAPPVAPGTSGSALETPSLDDRIAALREL